MNSDLSGPSTRTRPSTLLWVLASFPVACFTCALVTDFAYTQTADMMWANFSAWLLAVGMAGGVVAALAGLVHLAIRRQVRGAPPVWPAALGSVLVLLLALLNNLVHSRDAWTSVVPLGISLSVITVIVMFVTVWLASGPQRLSRVSRVQYAGVRS